MDDHNFKNGPLNNDVVLRNLFSIMDLKLLKTCRQVCKNWRDTIDPIFKRRAQISFLVNTNKDDFRRGRKKDPSVLVQLWDYELTMKKHTSEIPFTAFKFEGDSISWSSSVMQKFFKTNGGKMKELKIELFRRHEPIADLFECLSLIGCHAPQVETVKLKLISNEKTDLTNIDLHRVVAYCSRLTKLKWFSFVYRLNRATKSEIDVLSGNIAKLLSQTKSLVHYEINSPLSVVVSKLLAKESYSSLKYLSIEHVCMYKDSTSGINESVFQLLSDFSKQGLQLDTFFVEFWIWEEDNTDLFKKFRLLWQFLQSQSKCLKKLTISVVCQSIKPLRWYFPHFPKMEKLQYLKIIYGETTGNYFTFKDGNLGIPFPRLESLFIYYKTIGWDNIITRLLNTFEKAGEQLTYVHIAEEFIITRLWFDQKLMSSCIRHYEQAKLKIPNLKSFKITDLSHPTTKIACYNGCADDSYFSLNPKS